MKTPSSELLSLTRCQGSEKEAQLILSWRNDAVTRSMSIQNEAITWEDHWRWFSRISASADHLQFITHESDIPCGSIRFDRMDASQARVNVMVAPTHRGRGLAPRIIIAGSEQAFISWPEIERLRAEIRIDNIPSIRSFEHAGFCYQEGQDFCPSACARPFGVWIRDLTAIEGRKAIQRERQS